jgi:hypothetical protein
LDLPPLIPPIFGGKPEIQSPPLYKGRVRAFKGRDFVFGNFLTISADLKILKQPNHVKHLRIFSTIFEILKTLPLKGGLGWGKTSIHKLFQTCVYTVAL